MSTSIREVLKSIGFIHIRRFLTEKETGALADFGKRLVRTANKNYPVKAIQDPSHLEPAVIGKIRQVQRLCFGREMSFATSAVFSVDPSDPSGSVDFGFHQDHESFYELRDHSRYLNFYIPIEKERTDGSNVTLVSFAALKKADPELYAAAVGSGAARYVGHTRFDDDGGNALPFKAKLDAVSFTPQLAAGDLLLLRGDVIHRTQNQACKRTAMSIRCVVPDVPCDRELFGTVCEAKMSIIAHNEDSYGIRDYIFEKAGKDRLSAEELCSAKIELLEGIESAGRPPELTSHLAMFKARVQEAQRRLDGTGSS